MWLPSTEEARRVVFFAQDEATHVGGNYASTEHFLLGLMRDDKCVAARILDRMGVSLVEIRTEIERQITRGSGLLDQDLKFTQPAKKAIDLAYDEAGELKDGYMDTEHLLLGVIRESEGLAAQVLSKLGAELNRVRQKVPLCRLA